MNLDTDVIIIGAGAAGIAAAIQLQSTNLNFLILEARNRIGGRAYTDQTTFTPTSIDLGASWIHSFGPDNVLYNYHQSFDTDQRQHSPRGKTLYLDYDGQSFTNEQLFQAQLIYQRLDAYIEAFTLNTKNTTKIDESIEQVMQPKYEQLLTDNGPVKRLVDLFLSGSEQYDGSDLCQLSTKYWGVGSASGGDYWVSMGYGYLLEQIAHKHHLPIRLNTLVTKINTTDNNRIEITIGNDDQSSIISCRRVILTIPLGCLKKGTIVFQPPLPMWKREAIYEMGMGLMNKLVVQFGESFWGDDVGALLHACKERRGRFRFTLCIPSPANVLILFVTGSFAHELELLTDTEILKEIMTFLRQVFPTKTISDPMRYKFSRWGQDPLAYGSYSNLIVHSSPHTIAQLGKATSDGRVQWAGEHANIDDGSDEDWSFGCVHSAFESGQKAAKAIRDQLCSSS